MTRKQRLKKLFPGEFNYGQRIACRQHVGASNRAVVQACAEALGMGKKKFAHNFTRSNRDARHALYLGALKAHKENQDLFRRYRF